MHKTLAVAWREFWATVGTKGFVLGVFLPLIIMTVAITLMPILMNKSAPAVTGHVGILDRSGLVGPKVQAAFAPAEVEKRMQDLVEKTMEHAQKTNPMMADERNRQQAEAVMKAVLKAPKLSVDILPPGTSPEDAKQPIMSAQGKAKDDAATDQRLALAIVPENAVKSADAESYAEYEFYVAPKLDPQVQDDIRDQIGKAVIDARAESAGLDPKQIRAITKWPKSETKVVTKEGERDSSDAAALLIPGGFMILLWISVFTGGQGLLTSTVEEKGSRIMEVLLSAVSPMQLMVGKILGQMGVALVILLVYSAMGTGALVVFKQTHMVDPMNFLYLGIFFVLAFFMIAAMMAAIGSAVNDIREAQALMGPIMMILIIPMVLWMPISRNPNSTFAQVCSYIPPINPFIMVVRLVGSEKIPSWQIPISIATATAGAFIAAWGAAKIFRIGCLMYGKPPNLKTLIKWVRMA